MLNVSSPLFLDILHFPVCSCSCLSALFNNSDRVYSLVCLSLFAMLFVFCLHSICLLVSLSNTFAVLINFHDYTFVLVKIRNQITFLSYKNLSTLLCIWQTIVVLCVVYSPQTLNVFVKLFRFPVCLTSKINPLKLSSCQNSRWLWKLNNRHLPRSCHKCIFVT